jgi:hypothetical protein
LCTAEIQFQPVIARIAIGVDAQSCIVDMNTSKVAKPLADFLQRDRPGAKACLVEDEGPKVKGGFRRFVCTAGTSNGDVVMTRTKEYVAAKIGYDRFGLPLAIHLGNEVVIGVLEI